MKTPMALGSALLLASLASAQERRPPAPTPTPTPTADASRKSFFESRSNTAKGVPPTSTATPIVPSTPAPRR